MKKEIKKKIRFRTEKEDGNWSTHKYKLLLDDNLNPLTRILIVTIFDDTDTFPYKNSTYSKKLKVSLSSIKDMIDELVEKGYCIKEKKKGKSKHFNEYLFFESPELKEEFLSNRKAKEQPTPEPKYLDKVAADNNIKLPF